MKKFRTPDLGYIKEIEKNTPKSELLSIFSSMVKIRCFEFQVRKFHSEKKTTPLVYLSIGQEAVSAGVSNAMKGSFVCAQHRGHGPYIAFGGNTKKLRDELLGLPTGCCKGKGGSPMIHDFQKKIIGHSGLIGDQVPIANGIALATKKKVVCFFGDGAAEEDYVLASLGEAASKKLKVMFICDDNDLSVLTPTKDRRSWKISEVAKSFGMNAVDIADNPWVIDNWVKKFKNNLPCLINIRTCRDTWHVGSGKDDGLEWDRYQLTKQKLINLGLENEIINIENKFSKWANNLWQKI